MNSAIRKKILGTPLQALPDLWAAGSGDPSSIELRRKEYTTSMFGNHSQLLQQVVASSDIRTGWAPWQLPSVNLIGGQDPELWALGNIFDFKEVLGKVLNMAEDYLREAGLMLLDELIIALDVKALVGNVANLVPVAGPIVNIIVGILFAIGDLVKLSKQSTKATLAEQTIRPPNPSDYVGEDGDDAVATAGALEVIAFGDWTPLWLPLADPMDGEKPWIGSTYASWGCAKICNSVDTKGSNKGQCSSSGGRLIIPLSSTSWKSTRHGFGCVPGMPDIHRQLWVQPAGAAATGCPGTGVFDTGAWLPTLRSTAEHSWMLLMADGPSAFSVDPAIVRTAWKRYASEFFQQLDGQNGRPQLCGKTNIGDQTRKSGDDWMLDAAARTRTRKAMMCAIGSLTQADKPLTAAALEVTLNIMRPTLAMNALEKRQAAMLERTTIAYVNANTAAPALRDRIKLAQAAILESSDAVCKLDPSLIKDALFRANVESRQGSLGCGGAILSQSVPLGPGGPSVPPAPNQPDGTSARPPVPTTRGGARNGPARSTPGAPSRTSSTTAAEQKLAAAKWADEKKLGAAKRAAATEDTTKWTLVTIGTLGVVGVGGYIWHRKRKR